MPLCLRQQGCRRLQFPDLSPAVLTAAAASVSCVLNVLLCACAVLQEPLKVSYRPLTFYVFSEVAAALKHIMLVAAGFVGHTYGDYTYYTYNLPTEAQAAHGWVLGMVLHAAALAAVPQGRPATALPEASKGP